ncbi:MAG TPA: helix-turn-helix transcriptional regulator [Candidatus Izemoplasmatales bacterium]|nr:helix-turn-helix transcriptional regulator [Candidatus Izemoplasmatales bacterium]
MLDMVKIGNKLCELRQKKNMTQEDLANVLLVSHQAVSKWETGKALPSVDTLAEMTSFYNTSVEEILCLYESITPKGGEELFREHSRDWVIHETATGKIKGVGLEKIIHLLSQTEREYALYLMTEEGIEIGDNLWPRLSYDERAFLINKYRDKRYPLQIDRINSMMTDAEKRKLWR